MSWSRQIVVLALLALAGCGFRPLYSDSGDGGVSADLSAVAVDPIPDRLGQMVRNTLTDRFTRSGAADSRYRLRVALESDRDDAGFNLDRSVSRRTAQLTAYYQLYDEQSGHLVDEGELYARTSFDLVQSDYNTLAAEIEAERLLADEMARKIDLTLARFFATYGAAGSE